VSASANISCVHALKCAQFALKVLHLFPPIRVIPIKKLILLKTFVLKNDKFDKNNFATLFCLIQLLIDVNYNMSFISLETVNFY